MRSQPIHALPRRPQAALSHFGLAARAWCHFMSCPIRSSTPYLSDSHGSIHSFYSFVIYFNCRICVPIGDAFFLCGVDRTQVRLLAGKRKMSVALCSHNHCMCCQHLIRITTTYRFLAAVIHTSHLLTCKYSFSLYSVWCDMILLYNNYYPRDRTCWSPMCMVCCGHNTGCMTLRLMILMTRLLCTKRMGKERFRPILPFPNESWK